MVQAGKKWGEYLNPTSGNSRDHRLAAQFYDAQWVFYQIADYRDELEPWYTYASYAERIYRDEYLIPNDFRTQGFRRFPEGLYEDFRRGGDTTVEHLRLIRDKPAYSTLAELTRGPESRSGYSEAFSRAVAYAVGAHLAAEKCGLPRVLTPAGDPLLKSLLAMMENHLWEWRSQDFGDSKIGRLAPFMMGLTAYAVIEFYEWESANSRDPNAYWPQTHWPTIDAGLADVFQWLHADAKVVAGEEMADKKMWVTLPRRNHGAFRYMDRTLEGSGGPRVAVDLNQLIAPAYYWLYQHTGEVAYMHIGDELFAAGARCGAAQLSGKHFNQQYRLAFHSLKWRAAGARKWSGARKP